MDKEQVRQTVNEAVELFLEGGPGSGRYPAGSGKNPTPEDNVARAERASKKAEKTGKSDDYARASGRHMKAYLSLRDTDPEAAKKHYLKAEEHGVMARSTKDTKKARKAEENVAAGRQTPEERPRRMTTYHIKNAIRFLARQRRDNNPDW